MKLFFICAALLATVHAALAGGSANYTILADAIDAGGGNTGSASYSHIGSAGLICATSSGPEGALLSSGYVAQLEFDPAILLEVLSAVSRKVHGGAGAFDIHLPLTQTPGIECRTGGTTGAHQVVITFGNPITVGGISVMSTDGQAAGALAVNDSVATINLSAVTNAQTLQITLLQTSNGFATADLVIPMAVLAGDTNGNGFVTASDIGQTKSVSGQAATGANFRTDLNASGAITASDIGLVKSAAGTSLP